VLRRIGHRAAVRRSNENVRIINKKLFGNIIKIKKNETPAHLAQNLTFVSRFTITADLSNILKIIFEKF